jgi:Mg2+ and Co2+ transporter CorA
VSTIIERRHVEENRALLKTIQELRESLKRSEERELKLSEQNQELSRHLRHAIKRVMKARELLLEGRDRLTTMPKSQAEWVDKVTEELLR